MADDTLGPSVTRRRFLGGAITLVCSAPLLELSGCGDTSVDRPSEIDGWAIPAAAVLTPSRYAQLSALMDALIPSTPEAPGARDCNAAWYLDQLLGAFRTDPPKIYAGGPYSGRHGGVDGFGTWQRLTRVEEIRWRTVIEGSRGISQREFNGPVVGLVERYDKLLQRLEDTARARYRQSFASASEQQRRALFVTVDAAELDMAYQHAAEGTYGDPIYGGNRGGAGWRGIAYEGDRQPIGYTARQLVDPRERG